MHKEPDCVEYDQPDELTAKVRREMLREWTAHVEGMVRSTSDRAAACRLPDEEFRVGMDQFFQEVNAGNKGAIIGAVVYCLMDNRPVPSWVTSDLFNAYSAVTSGRHKSWDDVFGRPHEKGAQLAAMRRRGRLAIPIMNGVRKRQAAGEPISKNLFEAVGEEVQELISRGYLGEDNKKFSCKGTLVAKIYYERKKLDEAE
jgi:hypothetical protein